MTIHSQSPANSGVSTADQRLTQSIAALLVEEGIATELQVNTWTSLAIRYGYRSAPATAEV